ncbi:hypothetical protein [Paenibacillus glufosinatiresistens]|uniref:hypothetical protein n=1 Tax=Paenibacillus glufosinatiresistens TaxID=3070657 RepID=UPI00286E40F4|nr:hypothetical protein [Paenibacillus sp. YX.27]
MKVKITFFCFMLTLIFSVLSFIYYLEGDIEGTTFVVLGTIVALSFYAWGEFSHARLGSNNSGIWRSCFSLACSALILVIRMHKKSYMDIWGSVSFIIFILVIIIALNIINVKKL